MTRNVVYHLPISKFHKILKKGHFQNKKDIFCLIHWCWKFKHFVFFELEWYVIRDETCLSLFFCEIHFLKPVLAVWYIIRWAFKSGSVAISPYAESTFQPYAQAPLPILAHFNEKRWVLLGVSKATMLALALSSRALRSDRARELFKPSKEAGRFLNASFTKSGTFGFQLCLVWHHDWGRFGDFWMTWLRPEKKFKWQFNSVLL